MIYLLSGPDRYRLETRLKEIKKNAGINEDGINYRDISSDYNAGIIISEASAMPFLSEKRVLVLSGLLSSKNKTLLADIFEWLPNVPLETELIFIENEDPDQRLTITKYLNKTAKVEKFQNLTPVEIVRNIERIVTDGGGEIDKQTASLIQMYVGNDLIRVENETKKLLAYSKKVNKESVDLLLDAGYFNSIFDLTDSIATKNSKKAMHNLEKILESGESEVYLASMIAMQVRNLLIVQDLRAHGLSEAETVSRSKLHPFVVKKCQAQVRNFTFDQLISMHKGLLQLDIDLKSGTADPKILISRYILNFTV
jgi:DNA polymerase III subunit delta